jgi:hypothetical protein
MGLERDCTSRTFGCARVTQPTRTVPSALASEASRASWKKNPGGAVGQFERPNEGGHRIRSLRSSRTEPKASALEHPVRMANPPPTEGSRTFPGSGWFPRVFSGEAEPAV